MKILEEIKKETAPLGDKLVGYRKTAFTKFPLLFVLLSSFGVISTFYGFEKIIDRIPFFSNQPVLVMITGIVILLFTGTLYKKLS